MFLFLSITLFRSFSHSREIRRISPDRRDAPPRRPRARGKTRFPHTYRVAGRRSHNNGLADADAVAGCCCCTVHSCTRVRYSCSWGRADSRAGRARRERRTDGENRENERTWTTGRSREKRVPASWRQTCTRTSTKMAETSVESRRAIACSVANIRPRACVRARSTSRARAGPPPPSRAYRSARGRVGGVPLDRHARAHTHKRHGTTVVTVYSLQYTRAPGPGRVAVVVVVTLSSLLFSLRSTDFLSYNIYSTVSIVRPRAGVVVKRRRRFTSLTSDVDPDRQMGKWETSSIRRAGHGRGGAAGCSGVRSVT